MKKVIIALLLLALLLPILFACNPSSDASQGEESGEVSNENSQSASSGGATVEELNAVYKYDIDRENKERYLISTGKTYTFSREIYDGLPDEDGTKLTDEKYITAGTYEGTLCSVAFVGRNEIEITLDLGEVMSEISDFGLSVVSAKSMNAVLPKYIKYSISTDGNTFVEVGKVYRSYKDANNTNVIFELKMQQGVDARYIKAVVPKDALTSIWLYIDEFCVYKYKDSEKGDDITETPEYYNSPALPEVTEDLYWASSESDYNDTINLVKGKSYRITSGVTLDILHQTEYFNTPISKPYLTDGVYANYASYSDPAYFHITGARSRDIVFDLEKVSAVSEVVISFLFDPDPAVKLPTNVKIYLSMDGKGWGEVYEGTPTASESKSMMVKYKTSFDMKKARFVKVELSIASHVWIDEIQVFGKKNTDGAADIKVDEVIVKYPNEYISPDAMRGAKNLMLSYTFKWESREMGLNTKDEYLPYVAYLDKEGNIVDTFFDSFLFLPCMTVCPSGGRLYYYPSAPANMSDWLEFEDDLFYEDNNVNGLQLAVDEMDEALGIESEVPIYFSIFSTVINDKNFGDVDGDGINEDFSNIEDRKKVIKWWIDRLVARYEDGEYDNLRLDGFYWYHEAIETSDPHERELLKFTSEYLHSLGYLFIWIPYYQTPGFADWKSFGFDVACMQPNYMFTDGIPASRVYDNADLTKMLGMGVEIEIEGAALTNASKLEKYRLYLRAGVEKGYMNSIKMYYQDGGPGVFYSACKSANAAARSIYDDTYLYAKERLTLDAPEIKITEFEIKAGETLTITLETEEGDIPECELNIAPKYGSVKAVGDGQFEYYPIDGFTGTDSFVVTVGSSIRLGNATITVNVK